MDPHELFRRQFVCDGFHWHSRDHGLRLLVQVNLHIVFQAFDITDLPEDNPDQIIFHIDEKELCITGWGNSVSVSSYWVSPEAEVVSVSLVDKRCTGSEWKWWAEEEMAGDTVPIFMAW